MQMIDSLSLKKWTPQEVVNKMLKLRVAKFFQKLPKK